MLASMIQPRAYAAVLGAAFLLSTGCASLPAKAHRGNTAAVADFLDKGGSPDARFEDSNGCTLLHPAVDGGRLDIVELLLDRGADPNVVSGEGYTPLHLAAGRQEPEIARLLLARGAAASLDKRDPYGNTPLLLAVAKVKEREVWTFTAVGAVSGSTRAKEPSADLLETLLEAGADVQAPTGKGNTPLHIAAFRGHVNAVRLLLRHGADRAARNPGGETAADLARRYGQDEVVRVLTSE